MARVRVLDPKAPVRRDAARPKPPSRWLSGCRASSSKHGASPPSLAHGIHGRRRAGIGETLLAVPALRRRRGRAAHRLAPLRPATTGSMCASANGRPRRRVWLWIDRSASMGYASDLAQAPKIERALVLGLALGRHLRRGRRAGRPAGPHGARAHRRRIAENMAQTLVADRALARGRPAARTRLATPRRGRPDQRFPVARARHRGHGRGHLGPRCARPSRDDRRSRSRRPFRSRARPCCTISRTACRCGSAMPSPGARPTANASRSTGPSSRSSSAAAAGRSPSTAPTGRRARRRLRLMTLVSRPPAARSMGGR